MSTSDSHPDLVSKPLDERALAQIERNLDFGHGPSWALLAECRSLREQVETHKRERDFEVSSYVEENAKLRAERDEVRKAWRAWEAARDDGRFSSRFPETIEEAEADVAAAKAALDRLLGGAE